MQQKPLNKFEVFFLKICAAAMILYWIHKYGINEYRKPKPRLIVLWFITTILIWTTLVCILIISLKHIK